MVERICKNIIRKDAKGNVVRSFLDSSYLVIFESNGKEYVRAISGETPLSDSDIAEKIEKVYGFSECNLIQIIVL